MKTLRLWALALLLPPLASAIAHAGSVDVNDSSNHFSVRVTSLKQARYRGTIRQQYDYSCGSAALATLLTYQYGDPVSEQQVFTRMYERGDQAKIKREGFSLLDIKRYLKARGYAGDGFEVPLDKLVAVGLPAIALIRDRTYNHFVVIKGTREDRVLIGDPASGSRIVSRTQFEKLWPSRIVFIVHNKRENATFNAAADWRLLTPAAPVIVALSRDSLANITLLRPGPNDF